MTTMLSRVEQLHPDIITDFLDTGRSEGIPRELQLYIQQLQWCIEIREVEHERSINRAAQKLRTRIMAVQKIRLSIPACKKRISEALSYFSVDLNVPQKVWDLDSADKLIDLQKLAVKAGDFKLARQLELDANKLRKQAAAVLSDEDFEPHVFLMDPKITGADLGFEEENLKEIAAKCNDGFYVKLITDLPIEKDEKKKLFSDADVQDVDFEEVSE
ncbi:hypothetical protein [Draconibacterium sp.]|uniref:hypothetical protein n=1 Tax=Draconibacterium sp. TaxID=1965318 RepID=UPI00356AE625